jgi:hypothetical protein
MRNICNKIFVIPFTVVGLGLVSSSSALAGPTVWIFDLPSTAVASQTPPYPVVATLSLSQVGSDVQFYLDPNELSSGVADASKSFVDQIDFVYSGVALTAGSFVYSSGALVNTFSYETNQNNMDSSYKTQDQHVRVYFVKNKSGGFSFNDTSTWAIKDVTLTDFTNTFAKSNSKPSPIYGVISVSPYALTEPHPTPSNWVAAAVPEPETYAMLLVGLGMMDFLTRRRHNEQT